jgi:lipoyl(octanoyl) transferase
VIARGEVAKALAIAWLGRVPYRAAWCLQENLRAAILDGSGGDTLLLLEHDPVVTLGRSADPANVLLTPAALAARGIERVDTSRGGDVTYHGPGQLVAYPVVRIGGVRAYVEALAAAVVDVAAGFGIEAEWRPDRAGVWVGKEKLCAFGVHVRRRVAIHGLALNVTTPLEAFGAIVPCGLGDAGVTSIEALTGARPSLPEVGARLALALCDRLARTLAPGSLPLREQGIDSLLSPTRSLE